MIKKLLIILTTFIASGISITLINTRMCLISAGGDYRPYDYLVSISILLDDWGENGLQIFDIELQRISREPKVISDHVHTAYNGSIKFKRVVNGSTYTPELKAHAYFVNGELSTLEIEESIFMHGWYKYNPKLNVFSESSERIDGVTDINPEGFPVKAFRAQFISGAEIKHGNYGLFILKFYETKFDTSCSFVHLLSSGMAFLLIAAVYTILCYRHRSYRTVRAKGSVKMKGESPRRGVRSTK